MSTSSPLPPARDTLIDEPLNPTSTCWQRREAPKYLDLRAIFEQVDQGLSGRAPLMADRWSLHAATIAQIYRCLRERAENTEIKGMTITACEVSIEMHRKSRYAYQMAIEWLGETLGQDGCGDRGMIENETTAELLHDLHTPSYDRYTAINWADEASALLLCESAFRPEGMEAIVEECVGRELSRIRQAELSQQAPKNASTGPKRRL